MWALDNRTPFAADRSWVRDRDGAEIWLVAVKGTFNIHPDGSTSVADQQADVQLAAKYSGEPGKSSIVYDADLPRTKVTTDIIVNGHAYAPRGKPTKAVTVSFRVGDLVKSLRVTGDRLWKGFGFVAWRSRCRAFVKMPITYERAFGGMDLTSKNPKRHKWDPRNPVGTGVAKSSGHLIGKLEPNIHAVGFRPFAWFRKPIPAGFGVIAGHWTPRVKLAGTCGAKWQAERAPLLPEDFDDRFYQSVPPDQQTSRFLMGGEEVYLTNLTPGGVLAFRLPRVVLGFETDFGGEPVRHRANLHTVILEPNVPRVMLVWHTALPCHPKVTKLRRTRIIQKTLLSRPGAQTQPAPSESEQVFA
jgi:hypothetical protein